VHALVARAQRVGDLAQRAAGTVQLARGFVECQAGAGGLTVELLGTVVRLGRAPHQRVIDGHSLVLVAYRH
jgi:hypothetical protein